MIELPTPDDCHDLVAVAASAGGVEALKVLVADLPADLPAAVLVALHLPKDAQSLLAQILARKSRLPVVVAVHGAPLRRGHVYVATPDSHLLVRDDRILLGQGPRENGHRPAHDAMLRSVALAAGPRAVGVVLTGLLDDGAAGLAAVQRYGGTCIVQEPADSEFPSMPRAALAAVPAARSAPLHALAKEVARAVEEPAAGPVPHVDDAQRHLDEVELSSAERGSPVMADGRTPGEPSPFSCPDCHGVLNHVPDNDLMRFRCRTGHAWTSQSLAAQQEEQVEEALWIALRVLEERADLSRRLAGEAKESSRDWSSVHFSRRAEEADRSAALIRRVLDEELSSADRALPATGP
ncbi:MAG TPA: chemotaxis protein CheB [Mycobacteriales bacterium]|nr:chemotaxis protein CheB [Mycobacteriales bacterium]